MIPHFVFKISMCKITTDYYRKSTLPIIKTVVLVVNLLSHFAPLFTSNILPYCCNILMHVPVCICV